MRQIEYLRTLSGLAGLLVLASCTSTYYRALESVGIEKRDILVDRIDDTRDAQSEAKEQFSSALEQYRSVVDFEPGSNARRRRS
jgi:RecB family endonuclease NucS